MGAQVTGRAQALADRIRSADARKRVIECYDNTQGNAVTDAPEGGEAYEKAQHEHAILHVCFLLERLGLLGEHDSLETVADAYTEIT